MAEGISDQMKQLSLEPDKILGKSLKAELQFCESVKDLFVKRKFNQRIALGYLYSKIYVTLFFMSEKRLGEAEANNILSIVEKCFERENKILRGLGWCANFKIETEKIGIDDLNSRTTLSFVNNFVARWVGSVSSKGEETPCNYNLCTW